MNTALNAKHVIALVGWTCAIALFCASSATAQEASGLQAAAAIEGAMIRAIADSEKSIVAIARVSAASEPVRDVRSEIFPQFPVPMGLQEENPTQPDFVPNEYATGVIVDARGLVLTNAHVIKPGSDYFITTVERKVYRAEIVASDARSDLAVLRAVDDTSGSKFVPIKFGDAKKLKKGQIVIALGNPYAIARDGQPSASWGIISNLGRKIGTKTTPDQETLHHFGTLIQTDAKLNLGTSGGALVNLNGEMVGLTTSLAATSGYEQAAGYAIPIDEDFLRIIDRLKQGLEVSYGFLGIEPQNLRQEEVVHGAVGMRVRTVSPGTPARRAGLVAEDVITHINGEPLFDAAGLRLSVGRLPPGSVATLAVVRSGQHVKPISVTLSKGPNPGEKIVTQPAPSWRGMRVDYQTTFFPRLVLSSDIDDSTVAIVDVDDGSPAYKANLHRGMIITHVGTTPIHGPDDFFRQVASRSGEVTLWVSLPPAPMQSVVVAAE